MVIHSRKNAGGFNIKSTGFTLANQRGTLYFTDVPDATGDMVFYLLLGNHQKVMNLLL